MKRDVHINALKLLAIAVGGTEAVGEAPRMEQSCRSSWMTTVEWARDNECRVIPK